MQGDELLLIASLHSHLSDYAQTEDEYSEEEGKVAGKPEKELSKKGTVDKPGLLHALWKIHQGLISQAHGVKGLISIVEETDISDLPVVLPYLGIVTGAAYSIPNGAGEVMKDSEEA